MLLQLWVFETHVRKRLGRLGEQPEQLGASKPVLVRNAGSRASKPVLAQHFVLGVFADLKRYFGSPTKEAFVLRTDVAFAAMGAWDARSEGAWAAWRAARAAGG